MCCSREPCKEAAIPTALKKHAKKLLSVALEKHAKYLLSFAS